MSHIVDVISLNRWTHVKGSENQADCASRGLLSSELLTHDLWGNGPSRLSLPTSEWPDFPNTQLDRDLGELCDVCHQASVLPPVFILSQYLNFTHLIRVTAWVMRFIRVCCGHPKQGQQTSQIQQMQTLSTDELVAAERY